MRGLCLSAGSNWSFVAGDGRGGKDSGVCLQDHRLNRCFTPVKSFQVAAGRRRLDSEAEHQASGTLHHDHHLHHGGLQRTAENQDLRGSGAQADGLVTASRRRPQEPVLPPGHVHRPERGQLPRWTNYHQAEDQQPHMERRVHHGGPRRPQNRAVRLPRRTYRLRRLCGQLHHPVWGHPEQRQQTLRGLGESVKLEGGRCYRCKLILHCTNVEFKYRKT